MTSQFFFCKVVAGNSVSGLGSPGCFCAVRTPTFPLRLSALSFLPFPFYPSSRRLAGITILAAPFPSSLALHLLREARWTSQHRHPPLIPPILTVARSIASPPLSQSRYPCPRAKASPHGGLDTIQGWTAKSLTVTQRPD
jgi:hypothetical protein